MESAVHGVTTSLGMVVPELILLGAGCLLYTAAAFVSTGSSAEKTSRHLFSAGTLLALGLALVAWASQLPTSESAPILSPFRSGAITDVARGIVLLGGLVLGLLAWNHGSDRHGPEYFASLLIVLAGAGLVAAANDLVTLFLALELVSIPTYLLLYLARSDAASRESTLKYFLLSIFSSALVLYGLSFLYGAFGETNLSLIEQGMRRRDPGSMSQILLLAIVLVTAGLGFRITAVPFHFYASDVFAGTTTASAALLAIIPKVAGFAALVRLAGATVLAGGVASQRLEPALIGVLWLLALATMTAGNLLALVQTDIRRLLAYSGVAHAGYMLVGLAAGAGAQSINGARAILFYLAAYAAMTLGAFAVLAAIASRNQPATKVDDLDGLAKTQPLTAFVMTIFLFSLTGLPPTVGFWGKLYLLLAALGNGSWELTTLAVGLAVNAAIAGWYYLRVVSKMYLREPVHRPGDRFDLTAFTGMLACAAATVVLFVVPGWLWSAVARMIF